MVNRLDFLSFLPEAPDLTPHTQTIVGVVLRELQVDFGEFVSTSRMPHRILARRVVACLLRHRTSLSFPQIARTMCRPNHSTIIDEVECWATAVMDGIRNATAGAPLSMRGMTPAELTTRIDAAVLAEIARAESGKCGTSAEELARLPKYAKEAV